MPFFQPKLATCVTDGRQNVLCCSSCGGCGNHAHGNCGAGFGTKDPVVATCPQDGKIGVLCCTVCGSCGNHAHPHPH